MKQKEIRTNEDTTETSIEDTQVEIVYVVRKRRDEILGFRLLMCDVIQRLPSPGYVQVRERGNEGHPPFVISDDIVHKSYSSALKRCETIIGIECIARMKDAKYIQAVEEFRATGSSRERLVAEEIRAEVAEEITKSAFAATRNSNP